MTTRLALLATTLLTLPFAAEAQTMAPPVSGIYVGAAGGFNIKSNPNVNNVQSTQPGLPAFATPNLNLSTSLGGAAVGTIGYGLGNGLRVEVESITAGTRSAGRAATTGPASAHRRGRAEASNSTARCSTWPMISTD
jgi:OmpA-OmpF porin, OOP family